MKSSTCCPEMQPKARPLNDCTRLSLTVRRTASVAAQVLESFLPRMDELPEQELQRILSLGRKAWPAVRMDPGWFARRLGEKLEGDADRTAMLQDLPAADVYLACACELANEAALAEFERSYLTEVPAFVARIDPSAAFADEVKQELRDQLFVGKAGTRPLIAGYAGRGPLGAWLRVIAVRTALRVGRSRGGDAPPPDPSAAFGHSPDPELDYLKLRYRVLYEDALRAAVASLETRERLFLRLHYVDGLNIDRIGAMYRLHRSTVARRLAVYRRTLRERVHSLLEKNASFSPSESASILRLVRSQLFISLRSLA